MNREILNNIDWDIFLLFEVQRGRNGLFWKKIPTNEVKTSQTCSNGGRQEKKLLLQRIHECYCGLVIDCDENAARLILNWELTQNVSGWEPSHCGAGALAPLRVDKKSKRFLLRGNS